MTRKIVMPHPCVRGKLMEVYIDLGPGVGRFHRGEHATSALTAGRTRRRGAISVRQPRTRGLGIHGPTL